MVFLIGLLILPTVLGLTFENNGYQDVVVAIHPDIKEDPDIINKIKDFVQKGSDVLYRSTERYAYISSVSILVPTHWTSITADPSSGLSFEDGSFRVDNPNILHGDIPYTLQPGECGERGEYIHITPNYLLNLETTSQARIGQPGNVFVHEWAKYRYGVFEEYGYPGDPLYPIFYHEEVYEGGQVVSKLLPNFCTNVLLEGSRVDYTTGGSCSIDSQTGLPDKNCVFKIQGDNSGVKSSIMSVTQLESLDQFCHDGEGGFIHDSSKPNRQNFKCNLRSTWDVIINNDDFKGVKPQESETPPKTTFKVLRPQDERFVFVMDVSNSMADFDRLKRLKQSSSRWVNYEVRNGSYVGIVSFSDSAYLVHPKVLVSDDTIRKSLEKAINAMRLVGGTCLGDGLIGGMDLLNGPGDVTSGGIIIFITDGEFSCNHGINIDNPVVISRVKNSKVRIITIAFGDKTDPNLENLAVISDGKIYYVPDGTGIEDINSALEGSLTFQPSLPSGEVDIMIYSENFKDFSTPLMQSFVIDQSLGRNVSLTIDFLDNNIDTVEIRNPGFNQTFTVSTSPLKTSFDFLATGKYDLLVNPKRGSKVSYVNIVITSKAANDAFLPFYTRCWVSTGTDEVDASVTKLAVLAQVSQGNNPVMNAKVEAYIEHKDQPLPIKVDLLDNGAAADSVANDGIYSRYFVKFNGNNGDYTLKCQVKGDENTDFVSQRQSTFVDRIRRSIPSSRVYPSEFNNLTPICCGSTVDTSKFATSKTGEFERKVSGMSFSVINSKPNVDPYGPNQVRDLVVTVAEESVQIEFTAPGEDLDDGIASKYDLRLSQNKSAILDEKEWMIENGTLIVLDESYIIKGNLTPVEAGEKVMLEISLDNLTDRKAYYIAMRAVDGSKNISPISNVQNVYLDPQGLTGGAVAGIVIGVLLLVLIVSVVGYLGYQKKSNK